jgi:nucleotide-binding universal stress UspA family protein
MSSPGAGVPATWRADARPSVLARLVVGFDASAPSVRAVRLAVEMARGGRSRIWLVFAQQSNPRTAEPRTEEEVSIPVRATRQAMATLIREARDAGVPAEPVVREGDPASVILSAVRELDAGMIVVGTRGLGGAARVLLGSVSSRVVSEGSVPVVVVP